MLWPVIRPADSRGHTTSYPEVLTGPVLTLPIRTKSLCDHMSSMDRVSRSNATGGMEGSDGTSALPLYVRTHASSRTAVVVFFSIRVGLGDTSVTSIPPSPVLSTRHLRVDLWPMPDLTSRSPSNQRPSLEA